MIHTYDSSDISPRTLWGTLDARYGSGKFALKYDAGSKTVVTFKAALDAAGALELDAIVSDHKAGGDARAVAEAKTTAVAAIDNRTSDLIAGGFTYAGLQFSLSANAQMKMVGTHAVRDDANLTYPVKWNTLDDADTHELADSAALHAFYLTGLGAMRAHIDGGTVLKDAVRAAATIDEVAAVVDAR